MVSLSNVLSSNSRISATLPPDMVALFVGGTSGIGEATLKKFAQYTIRPRVYIVGRSQEAADRIVAECRVINPAGSYVFLKADVSLIRVVDEVCTVIKAKEQTINLLFLTCGVADFNRTKTAEDIHLLAALNYYARIRFISNLLPLIRRAPAFRRVVTVGGGGYESGLDTADFPALRVPPEELRGHLTTLVTLGLEAVAQTAPDVSFIHNYPGAVWTKITARLPEEFTRNITFMPSEESGERQLYMATSARFAPGTGVDNIIIINGVALEDGIEVAVGTSGKAGSGIYSVGSDCESASPAVLELLGQLREQGLVEEVRRHTDGEFQRVTAEN